MKGILLINFFLCLTLSGFSQSVEQLEKSIDQKYGIDRLKDLNQLAGLYLESTPRKAFRFSREAVDLSAKIFHTKNGNLNKEHAYLQVDAYNLLGESQYQRNKYESAKKSFDRSLELAKTLKYQAGTNKAEEYLTKLTAVEVKDRKVDLEDIKVGKALKSKAADLNINATHKLAVEAEKNGNTTKAINLYQREIQLRENEGDYASIASINRKVGEIYQQSDNRTRALHYYSEALRLKEGLNDTTELSIIRANLEQLNTANKTEIETIAQVSPWTESEQQEIEEKKNDYIQLATKSELSEDYKKSLEYYKLYTQIRETEQAQQLALLEKTNELDRRSKDLSLLQQEKEIQDLQLQQQEKKIAEEQAFKTNLAIGLGLVAIFAIGIFVLYRSKNSALTKLDKAYTDLQETQVKLVSAEQRIKKLLNQQVGPGVAEQLMVAKGRKDVQKKFVCVMFLDIRGFTPFVEQKKPEEIIAYQNAVFGFMIDIIDKHHGIINQFLGDGFMATFGVSDNSENVCQDAVDAAEEILKELNAKIEAGEVAKTEVGIGLHAGDVVAGNVGTDLRQQYSVTGNTVILAARLEQLNKEHNSQLIISEEVHEHLIRPAAEVDFISVQVKGRKEPIKIMKVA